MIRDFVVRFVFAEQPVISRVRALALRTAREIRDSIESAEIARAQRTPLASESPARRLFARWVGKTVTVSSAIKLFAG